MRVPAPYRLFLASLVTLSLGGAGYLAAIRAGRVASRPGIVAALALALGCGLAVELGRLGIGIWRRRVRCGVALGRTLVLTGLLAAIGGGTVNWLLSLQGYVVLVEGETMRLGAGDQLEELAIGPLGDPRELAIDLALVGVDLRSAAAGTFDPVSLVEARRPGEPVERQEIGGGRVGRIGPLVLRQGTFGYAPRLVVLHESGPVLDRVVPFTTRRDGRRGTSFVAAIELEQEGLSLTCEVLLNSLDDQLRGHPTLAIAASKGERRIGAGDLALGEFAEVGEGYRLGFADLRKWSEIDVSRRSYRAPTLMGGATVLAGLLIWPLAAWRRW